MHSFTRNYIDSVAEKAIFQIPVLKLVPLTNEDIAQYKKDFKEEKFKSHVPKKSLPPKPLSKKLKMQKKRKDVSKLVLSEKVEIDQFKSHFKSVENSQKNQNSSPPLTTISPVGSNNIENMIITSDESIESTSFNSLIGTIKICDFKTLMDDAMYKRYVRLFLQNTTNNLINIVTPDIPLNNIPVSKDKLTLTDIENLYMKYFSKSVQDTIVIIANILYIILISNIHQKARMDETLKKGTKDEKLKERVDANRMHMRHKKVLEMKFKKYFMDVITSFDNFEFDHAFKMFFLSILTVLSVLDPPKFKNGSIYRNLILLLMNSLKGSEYEDKKIFGMLRDKKFSPACIDLFRLIKYSRENDPCITDRMAIFFLPAINDRKYFRPIIDAITGDSNEDLELLIDSAADQCFCNSKFKDPINRLLKMNISSNNNEDKIHWVIAKNSNGNYQPIPVSFGKKPPKIARYNFTSSKAVCNFDTFLVPFSNSLKKPPVPCESVVSKAIAPEINVDNRRTLANGTIAPKLIVIPPITLANSSITQATTLKSCKSAIQNIKNIPSTSIQKINGNKIIIGNKQFKLVKCPSRTVSSKTNNNIYKTPQNSQKPLVPIVKCCAKNCKSNATIMCSACISVRYCSKNCQKLDWYDSHINNCQNLLKLRQIRITKKLSSNV